MAKYDISSFSDDEKAKLVESRWTSSSEVWDKVASIYKSNTAVYENNAEWLQLIPERRRRFRVQANRIFVNMEAVINSLIANPPGINILPARKGEDAQDFASKLENYFRKKYQDLNVKEILRMGLRNLYFGRLLVIKAFWNPTLGDGGDFDYRAIDPRKVRMGKYARKEQDSEFVIEEIEDNLCAIVERFPKKKVELMKKFGILDDSQLYINNPDVTYKEAWIQDYVIFKIENIILDCIKNPYWDWDGILITNEEAEQLNEVGEGKVMSVQARRDMLQEVKLQQDQRKTEMAQPEPMEAAGNAPEAPEMAEGQQGAPVPPQEAPTPVDPKYKPYFFNYFDAPRKPYIFATVFNNENTPIGRTDMITLSAELQRGIDKRKMDIDENCELANGVLKVDASVMGKADAQRIRFETKGIIWGKGVKDGVTRETGQALPQMVFDDMQDSRSEIDNIMAASSAFRGERQGQETKAGRLALVQQSYLRLNELVQVVEYASKEVFEWGFQLAKTRYTEYHYAKWMGDEDAQDIIELIQDDFETGSEVLIIAGKTLPVDDEWKFEQAQADFKDGALSLPDYLRIAKYDDSKQTAKNTVLWKMSPTSQINLSEEEKQAIKPPMQEVTMSFGELPAAAKVQYLANAGMQVAPEEVGTTGSESISIAFKDMPVDAQSDLLRQLSIKSDPNILVAERMAENASSRAQAEAKKPPIQPKK